MSMKKLGQFNEEVGNKYMELLNENRIEVEATDVPVSEYDYKGQNYAYLRVELLVSEDDYDKAIGLIKDYERKLALKIQEDGKAADKDMIKFVIGLLCVIGIIIYIGYRTGG